MASTYALPFGTGNNYHQGAHLQPHHLGLLPDRSPARPSAQSGANVDKPTLNGALHDNRRDDRENTSSRHQSQDSPDHSPRKENVLHTSAPMKGRPRGVSDLGRPANKHHGHANGFGFPPVIESRELSGCVELRSVMRESSS